MSNWGEADVESSQAARDIMNAQSNWLKVPVGPTYMRSCPPHKGMVDPNTGKLRFYEPVCLHFGVGPGGKGVVPCPRRMVNGFCPICEFAFDLRNKGREREGNKLLPSWQGYVNVIVYDKAGEPVRNKAGELEVKVWSASRKTLDKLFAAIDNYEQEHDLAPGSINIADPKKGLTIKLVREGTGMEDTSYQVFVLKPIDIMPLVAEWDEKLTNCATLSPLQTSDQLKLLMSGEGDDPYAKGATKVAEKPNYFDDEGTVEGEFRHVAEGEGAEPVTDANRADAAARLKAMVEGKKAKEKADEPDSE
jgi:hypothetical protein